MVRNGALTASAADSAGASLTTALQEQLGLRLQAQRVPIEAVVIDVVDMPSPD
jgi:uncharacterized protein (TIGR03435 family)